MKEMAEDFTRLREDEIAELLERKVVANLKTMLVVFTVSRDWEDLAPCAIGA